jgi:hypothetical protein
MSARDERRPEAGMGETKPPAVACLECDFSWRSPAMAEGLRLLGSCPRCGGELRFAGDAVAPLSGDQVTVPADEPHLALGLPRPPRR